MRARLPDGTGYAIQGVRIYFEAYGRGDPTVLFVPGFAIAPARKWKMQLPFFARDGRAIAYDPRGTGGSDRPKADYGLETLVGDALAVVDAVGVDEFAAVAISGGARPAVLLAARYPERITALVIIGGSLYLGAVAPPTMPIEERRAWALRDYEGWARDWWATSIPEPRSTKARDDGWEWAQATDAPTLIASSVGAVGWSTAGLESVTDAQATVRNIRCPVLVIHGTQDRRVAHEYALEMQRLMPQAVLVTIDGAGHFPHVRDPVRTNLILREFLVHAEARKVA